MKKNISIFLTVLGISMTLVLLFNISPYIYFFTYFVGFTVIRLNLSVIYNKEFYIKTLLFNFIFYWMFLIEQYGMGGKNFSLTDFCIFLVIFLDLYITSIWLIESKDIESSLHNDVSLKILSKRKEDLKLLEDYIEKFDIVGLNGKWGSGKSFLVNQFKEKFKSEYEFIEIDLLTSNLNEVQLTLLNSFEEVLLKNRILPRYTNNLKKNLTSLGFLGKIQNFISLALSSNELKSGVFKSFINETRKLKNKKFLIIFEDIDRIDNKENLKEIFAISEKIAYDNIKILYQYDEDLLLDKEFSFEYLEKYIPFKINITNLHIVEIINFLIEEKSITEQRYLSKDDFTYLYFLSEYRFTTIPEILNYDFDINYKFDYVSFRKLDNMITEISNVLQKNPEYLQYKEITISFFVLKHLLPNQFKNLRTYKEIDLFRIYSFKNRDNQEYSILDLIKDKEESPEGNENLVKQIFQDEDNVHSYENRMTYLVLKLFDYKLYSKDIAKDEKEFISLKNTEKYKHEKFNRIIQKLLYEGSSILTDHEFAKEKFKSMVLNEKNDQIKNYNKFLSFFNGSNEHVLGNKTVFVLTGNPIETLFESFNISSASTEEFMELLTFYLNYLKKDNICDITLLRCFNQIRIDTEKQLLDLMNIFNTLEIQSNFNTSNEFHSFVKNFMDKLFYQGILESNFSFTYYQLIDVNSENIENEYLKTLKNVIENLQESKEKFDKLNLENLIFSRNQTIEFIEKIVSLIEHTVPFNQDDKPKVTTKISSRYMNQEEYDEILTLYKMGGDFRKVLDRIMQSYDEGKITIIEIEKLLMNLNTD